MLHKVLLFFLGSLLVQCTTYPSGMKVETVLFPTDRPSETPNWYLSPQGSLYLSWTQHSGDTSDELHYAIWQDTAWGNHRTVAKGNDWFVNWADFPSITTFASSDLSVLAHYLQKSDTGRNYNYGVKLALSRDGGEHFNTMDSLHDSGFSEHGFVSLVPFSFDKVMAVWLDGRAMSEDTHSSTHQHGDTRGAMQLRSAFIHFDQKILEPLIIDDRVCECCQTDLAMSPKGPIVVYRNRSEMEERDIFYSRYNMGVWTEPKPIFEDHWKINGCPVNGPAIASLGQLVVVVWYTEAGGEPTIKCSISEDSGEHFKNPIPIPTLYTLGRVDVLWIDETHLAISFVDKTSKEDEQAQMKLDILNTEDNAIKQINMGVISPKRRSGFPVIEKKGKEIYMAYTQVNGDKTSVKVDKISW